VKGDPTPGSANEYASKLEKIHTRLKSTIRASQHCYQVVANRKRSPSPKIQVGDQVFILAKFIRTTRPSRKLAERCLGPFEVTAQPGTHSYLVKLPNHLRAIHPVFHVSQLEPAHPSNIPNHSNLPPPPIEIDGQLEFEVAERCKWGFSCYKQKVKGSSSSPQLRAKGSKGRITERGDKNN